jgi:TolB-like protein
MADDVVMFGQFRLDLGERKLTRKGAPVRVSGRALEVLCVLAAAKGEIVTKDDLMARVWPGLVVEENALHVHVSGLRKMLDEEMSGQCFIVTAQGRGYRLVGVLHSGPECSSAADDLRVPGTSIAVMAFQNMSGDPEQEYFVDGIVEDIITGLARIRWLLVIARNSSFIYKGKAVDAKQVGRELGVRYVLEGSVRKVGNRVRITVQLIETQTGAHIWAERYDRLLDDIFAVQDDIAVSVIGTIEPNLRKAEVERVKRKRLRILTPMTLCCELCRSFTGLCPRAQTRRFPSSRTHLNWTRDTPMRTRRWRGVSNFGSTAADGARRITRRQFTMHALRSPPAAITRPPWRLREL